MMPSEYSSDQHHLEVGDRIQLAEPSAFFERSAFKVDTTLEADKPVLDFRDAEMEVWALVDRLVPRVRYKLILEP